MAVIENLSYALLSKKKVIDACDRTIKAIDDARKEKAEKILSRDLHRWKFSLTWPFITRESYRASTMDEWRSETGYCDHPEHDYSFRRKLAVKIKNLAESAPAGIGEIAITADDFEYIEPWFGETEKTLGED